MIQKKQIISLKLALQRVRNVAKALEWDAKDFDVHFAKQRADELTEIVDDALKEKKTKSKI